jgi:enolase
MQIKELKARQILDSRGQPTVEVDVILNDDTVASASVPSGASTGQFEALELRDKNPASYMGKSVSKAIHNVLGPIQQALKGRSIEDQRHIDKLLIDLDGTADKSVLGANAILAVSLAVARAKSLVLKKPLYMTLDGQDFLMPVPLMNILNGGAHANNQLDIQEFMVMPIGAVDFSDALQMGYVIVQQLKQLLQKQGLSTAVGDEGGFAPALSSHHQALDYIMQAIEMAGLKAGKDVCLALDVAASEWYQNGLYTLPKAQKTYQVDELIQYYQDMVQQYPIMSIEDGLAETDWIGWKKLTDTLGAKIQLVGDDLFVTNPIRFHEGIEMGVANAILIKLNQIGTLTETLDTMHLAKKHGYRSIVSHRSGETEDNFIADLAVATGCGQIKTGSLCRTDRVCKYNQLLRIAENQTIPYAGKGIFSNR